MVDPKPSSVDLNTKQEVDGLQAELMDLVRTEIHTQSATSLFKISLAFDRFLAEFDTTLSDVFDRESALTQLNAFYADYNFFMDQGSDNNPTYPIANLLERVKQFVDGLALKLGLIVEA